MRSLQNGWPFRQAEEKMKVHSTRQQQTHNPPLLDCKHKNKIIHSELVHVLTRGAAEG